MSDVYYLQVYRLLYIAAPDGVNQQSWTALFNSRFLEVEEEDKSHTVGRWDSVRFQLLHTTVIPTTTPRFTA
jgi:hypothetical protein